MLSYLGKFLEITGLLLAGSGIIGITRLKELEIFVGKKLKDFLSRKGFQDFLQRGGILAENQGTLFARIFSFLSLIFDYLSAIVSMILSITIIALIFPTTRKFILDLIVNNKELVNSILRFGGYLLAFCVAGLFLSLLISMVINQPMIKPLSWFAKKTIWYSDNLQSGLESSIYKFLGMWANNGLALIKLIPKPKNKWLRCLLYIPFTSLIIVAIFIPISIPLILWMGLWLFVIGRITGFFNISLFYVSLSILQIVVLLVFVIAYAIAGVLFLPYAVLERSIKDKFPQLTPGSAFIIVGYLLSIIGILLQ